MDGVRSGHVEGGLAEIAEKGEEGNGANKSAEEHNVTHVA